jgi:hypothetical protein
MYIGKSIRKVKGRLEVFANNLEMNLILNRKVKIKSQDEVYYSIDEFVVRVLHRLCLLCCACSTNQNLSK